MKGLDGKIQVAGFYDDVIDLTVEDRAAIARVLARHGINLQLAKISTLGERVEDTFLVDGAVLRQNKAQLQIESELLDAVSLQP